MEQDPGLNLPTAPERPVIVMRERDRPQPRPDSRLGKGMSVSVGRITLTRDGVKMIVLGHNTVGRPAGNGVLIAELLYKLNIL